MKEITIEDVLAKHAKNYKKTIEENDKSLYHLVLNGFEAINFAKEWASLNYGWQLCPKCNGDGNLARYNSPNLSTSTHPICDVCNGAKIIAVASLNRQGCRWTKCSDKKPPINPDEEVVFRDFEGAKTIYIVTEESLKIIMPTQYEYLDESIEPCATSSENYWKQRCELIEELVDKFGHLEVYGKATENYNKLFNKWQQLKSTPSPTGDRCPNCNEIPEFRQVETITNHCHWAYECKCHSQIRASKEDAEEKYWLWHPSKSGDRDCEELKERIGELEEGLRKIIEMKTRFSDGSLIIDIQEKAKKLLNL